MWQLQAYANEVFTNQQVNIQKPCDNCNIKKLASREGKRISRPTKSLRSEEHWGCWTSYCSIALCTLMKAHVCPQPANKAGKWIDLNPGNHPSTPMHTALQAFKAFPKPGTSGQHCTGYQLSDERRLVRKV